jgi:hypothetical protein
MFPEASGHRLVTQNLLADAGQFEISNSLDLNSIAELSKFIDIFCLYDKIAVLGRHSYSMLRQNSEFFEAITSVIEVKEFTDTSNVVEAACIHLGNYLEETESDSAWKRRLFDAILSPDVVERTSSAIPDSVSDFELGDLWLKTLPTNADVISELEKERDAYRGAAFLIRSFLYLAYSDVNGLPFTPDAVRGVVLNKIIKKEQALRSRLMVKIRESGSTNLVADSFDLTRRVSPLAAIVFERAWPKKNNIVSEMITLRNQLSGLRERIRVIEQGLLFANSSEEKRLSRKWESIFNELERAFGKGEGLLTIKSGIGLAEAVGKVVDDGHKVSSWTKLLLGLPVETAERMLARRPLVELYQLRRAVPSSSRLRKAVDRLFGE